LCYFKINNFMKKTFTTLFCSLILVGYSQKLPNRYHFNEDSSRLSRDISDKKGIYNDSHVDTVFLTFSQSNYATLLTNNYQSKTNIIVKMTYKGVVYDSVGIRYKGQTSYSGFGTAVKKKSYDVEMDWLKAGQDLNGYSNLNFNNWYDDKSAMREVVYNNLAGNHIPNARGGFICLYINGVSNGLYLNVQSLDKQHVSENFFDENSTRWRAESSGSTGMGGFGEGNSTLNDKGTDTASYKSYYTLKKAYKAYPWRDLMKACNEIAKVSATTTQAQYDTLNKYFDIDEALWFLASENIYVDDDGYLYKGGMDYFVYFDAFSKKLLPIEYDGNSSFYTSLIQSWDVFYRESSANFPLMNKLMKVPQIRQRYLAHYRTILDENFRNGSAAALVDKYAAMINPYLGYTNDNVTKANVLTGITELKTNISTRLTYLNQNTELAATGLSISAVTPSVNNVNFARPSSTQTVKVNASVTGSAGVSAVYLYYGQNLEGGFTKLNMTLANNVYSATIPALPKGTYVRYYIEAIANNTAKTASYMPVGAEHDVYLYRVKFAENIKNDIVINEVMASNQTAVADNRGLYGDWIELYNKSTLPINISGYYLSDNEALLTQYQIPTGTTIAGNDYLVFWADDLNTATNGEFHTNFKLNATADNVYLATPSLDIADHVEIENVEQDSALARLPNATGPFITQAQSFQKHNNLITFIDESVSNAINVYPNPSKDMLHINANNELIEQIAVYNLSGVLIKTTEPMVNTTGLDVSDLDNGMYLITINNNQSFRISVLR
jgi:spore coat protein CotH